MKSKHFEGWYLKHQKDNNTIAFIPGVSENAAFIQIVTNDNSFNIIYPLASYKHNENIHIGNCMFSKNGIEVNIDDENIKVFGKLEYSNLTPIKYDIMGIFKYFPMECRHGIISMHHNLKGHININGKNIDFTNGIGYIENDSGTSFPKTYLWVHCNDFKQKCSIMASIADIPFLGFNFKGCICVVYYNDKEYRLATYLGVKVESYNDKKVVLRQGKYRLDIEICKNDGAKLYAPIQGDMTKIIHESASCSAKFKFYIKDKLIFDMISDNASFEFV